MTKRLELLFIVLFVGAFAFAAEGAAANGLPNETTLADQQTATALLTVADHHIYEAMRAGDENARIRALRAAQDALDGMGKLSAESVGAPADIREAKGWIDQNERDLTQFQNVTRKEVRASLMGKVWVSHYQRIPEGDLDALGVVSDILRLLREIERLGGSDPEVVEDMRSKLWNDLMSYREAAGPESPVLEGNPSSLVIDQRVVKSDIGEIEIYQLIGTEDRVLNWVLAPTAEVPEALLQTESLTVDLSREEAPWLLIFEGENLARHLDIHRHWLAAVDREVRLLLRESGDYALLLRDVPGDYLLPQRRAPYLFRSSYVEADPRLYLVQVNSKKVVGSWELSALESTDGESLKLLIDRILVAAARG